MQSHRLHGVRRFIIVSASLFLVRSPLGDARAQDADATGDEPQVMTRGPVHEAFAAPMIHDPKPGPVVTKQPPQAVEELPPDQKPAGANIQWIPGYWQWDEGRSDFLWISGVWRDPPPGRQWVPGYWNQVQGGYQWVPGAWMPSPGADPAVSQVSGGTNPGSGQPLYLPAPPASLEAGPSSPAPSGEVFWTPGCWTWQGARYLWRPGFWAAVQPGWVWMPSQLVWTPSGYLFVQGYWDLPIASRGLLFAPIYYPRPVYLRPGFVYTPSVTIMSSGFTANLFVQPAYAQYCFGDYYAQSFLSVGIFPWFSMSIATGPRIPRFHDPLFSYYSVVNIRRDPHWVTRVREEYIVRRDNVAMRPPRTFVEQTRMVRIEGPRGGVRERIQIVARPVGELARHSGEAHAMRLERVDAASRREWQNRAAELRSFREQRVARERDGARSYAAAVRNGGHVQPRPMNLTHSPVAARPDPDHAGLERRGTGDRPRQDQVARAGERRSPASRPGQSTDRPGGQHAPGQPNGRTAEFAGRPRGEGQRVQPGMQNPGMRGNGPHPGGVRFPGRGTAERRIPPPHPTPIQREHREHKKG